MRIFILVDHFGGRLDSQAGQRGQLAPFIAVGRIFVPLVLIGSFQKLGPILGRLNAAHEIVRSVSGAGGMARVLNGVGRHANT